MVLRVFAEAVKATPHYAIRIVRAQVIDTRIGGIDVEEVGHHRSRAEPGLANEVLFVPTVTDSTLRHIRVRHREMAGGIHVPQRVGIEIGLLVIGFQTGIGDDGMIVNNLIERIEDIIPVRLTVHIVVIAIRDSGNAGDDVGG